MEQNITQGPLRRALIQKFVVISDSTYRILSVSLNTIFPTKTFRVICNRH